MSAPKPAVKDVSITLLNAPRGLMLGTKQYPLEFTIINFREEGDLSIAFSSDSMSFQPASIDLHLAAQEKKTVTTTVSPIKDGGISLSVIVDKKKIIKYTETVLEGHENDDVAPPASEVAPSITPSTPAPVNGTLGNLLTTPATAAAGPVKPIKPIKPAGASAPAVQKPSGAKPPAAAVQKPSGEKPPATAVQKPASPDNAALLQAKIMEVREEYMACRAKLQASTQGTPEYKATYDKAVSLKAEYENLSKIYESGGPVPEAILKKLQPADPIEELKGLMARYNELKDKLAKLDQSSPDYATTRQAAMDTYNLYNEKRTKAKEQGLIS